MTNVSWLTRIYADTERVVTGNARECVASILLSPFVDEFYRNYNFHPTPVDTHDGCYLNIARVVACFTYTIWLFY